MKAAAEINEGSIEVVRFLLDQPEIDPNAKDVAGNTALLIATRTGHFEKFQLLFEAPGVDQTAVNDKGLDVLELAAKNENEEITEFLKAQGYKSKPERLEKSAVESAGAHVTTSHLTAPETTTSREKTNAEQPGRLFNWPIIIPEAWQCRF